MLKIQKHRGPDDSGVIAFNLKSSNSAKLNSEAPEKVDGYFEGVLGFNRLSILDLSSNGHQPMTSQDGKVLLTLNGEVYNAFDFKSELKDWGYKFKSTTDTEIVLALYLKYGLEGLLKRLNGMFAIVIVDMYKKEIIITRDRFGIKPMYYVSTSKILAFSSELKSFLFIKNFKLRLAEDQIDEYLLFRNNLCKTLFKDILSLPPGHYLSYNHVNGLKLYRYFDINNLKRSPSGNRKIGYYEKIVEDSLSKSVESQLMSDVKLGCQLSGGIDSSLITWLANRNSSKGSFEAVSIIFNDHRFNEEKYINYVTESLGITSHKFLLDSGYFYDNIEKVSWHLEEPINHPNTVAIYKLSQKAKEYVTVLLSGEGADEVFGGYNRFYDIRFPYGIKRLLQEAKANLIDPRSFAGYFDRNYRSVIASAFINPLLAKRMRKGFSIGRAINERKSLYNSLTGSPFDRQVKYEMLSYLPNLLIRQDKMSMAHSIENRVPFLDNIVVEKSFSVPEEFLIIKRSTEDYNTEKYLLKKITSSIFGNAFAFRDKMGFGIPIREYFLNPRFNEYLKDKVLPGLRARGLFNHNLTSKWLSKTKTMKYNELEALWVVVSFEIWASVFLDTGYENSDSSS